MTLRVSRILLFAKDMAAMAEFYGEKLGLAVAAGDAGSGFIEFDAGAVRLALHSGGRDETRLRPPKIVFLADDVEAARAALMSRGVRLGKVKLAKGLHLCDGKDPEGNAFQLSNRA
jgi:catechol 2,3-dioxygenase-like lactoylglutathione lyase family enzyme